MIHKSYKTLSYVYILTHRETKEFYIGVRYANKVPSSEDLGILYFTSSKTVFPIFHQFEKFIIAEFFNYTDALEFETGLIKENFKDPLCLNKSYSGYKVYPDMSDWPEDKIKSWKEKLSRAKRNKSKTEEHRKRQSEVRLGKTRSKYKTQPSIKCSCIVCKKIIGISNITNHYKIH